MLTLADVVWIFLFFAAIVCIPLLLPVLFVGKRYEIKITPSQLDNATDLALILLFTITCVTRRSDVLPLEKIVERAHQGWYGSSCKKQLLESVLKTYTTTFVLPAWVRYYLCVNIIAALKKELSNEHLPLDGPKAP